MRVWKIMLLCFLFVPLVVDAETISWILPTTNTDGSTISAVDRAKLCVYLRGWKEGNAGAKTYFGETRNGATSWTDNVMVKMNQWGAQNAVPGWVTLKPGDNVMVTASTCLPYTDNTGVNREIDGPESAPVRHTIPGAPAPPPWKPPPSCNAPTGLTIRP